MEEQKKKYIVLFRVLNGVRHMPIFVLEIRSNSLARLESGMIKFWKSQGCGIEIISIQLAPDQNNIGVEKPPQVPKHHEAT